MSPPPRLGLRALSSHRVCLHCFRFTVAPVSFLFLITGFQRAFFFQGLNGLDNGYLILNNVRVPRSALLNKLGGVSRDGKYVTPFKDKNKRFGAVLGTLSGGRIGIAGLVSTNLVMAVTIAVRYSCQRKQFGPPGGRELPVIDYQMQQWRVFPYLAAAFIWSSFSTWFCNLHFMKMFAAYDTSRVIDEDFEAAQGKEIHALSCAAKAMSSWVAQHSTQEAREACGGHGYLTVNRIGDLRDTNDANCTYEGDNNCILMQASNLLVQLYNTIDKGRNVTYCPFLEGEKGSRWSLPFLFN